MSADNCPITNAITIIRGGYYRGREEYDDMNVIVISGGSGNPNNTNNTNDTPTYVCDDISYYMTKRRIAFARKDVAERNNIVTPAVHTFAGKTYRAAATEIINSITHHHLYDQLTAVCDIIARVEDLLNRRISGGKKPVNVTLCSLCDDVLSSISDPRCLFNAAFAYSVCSQIVSHVGGTDVNVLLTSPVSALEPAPEFTEDSPDWNLVIPEELALEHEMIVAEYLMRVEEYHCKLIRSLARVHAVCDEIISKLR